MPSPERYAAKREYYLEKSRAYRRKNRRKVIDAESRRQQARRDQGLCIQCGAVPGLKGNSKTVRYSRCKPCFVKTHPEPELYTPTEEDLAYGYPAED